ncbi:hypothetical protein [Sphingomonas sp. CCH5-D11]|uniref:hypothetical protein n=1 Tax=Sphingomonas sp. CCH5-D11 TaxID=1768786 RepID=UPI0008355C68|nr:hypothetical protein [Sphingomonas sp. CCH5-D11]
MTASVATPPHQRGDEMLIELAILGVLAERTEVYPSHLVGELRRRLPCVAGEEVRPVLERLWREKRVARLWHRYLLPDRVPAVRKRWLEMIDRRREDLEALESNENGYVEGRAALLGWDGWRVGNVDA